MCSICVSITCVVPKLFIYFVLFCVLQHASGLSFRHKRENVDVQNYLMRFGYLSESPKGAGAAALRTEVSIRQAIRELQEFSGLPITGKLDERTQELLKRPRCGLKDFESFNMRKRRKRFMLQGQRWPYSNLTWSLRSSYLKDLNAYEVRYVVSKALDVWAKHSRLTFTEIDSDRADILVYFHRGDHGDNFAFDGQGQILAHAFFPGTGRGGDAHFDLDENWLTREDDNAVGTSLFHVAAHEFGHSLGLSHSSVEGALMYPWYQGMQNGFEYDLPDDDRLGVQALYGTYQDKLWGRRTDYRPAPTIPTPRPTPRTTPTTLPPPTRPHYPYPNLPPGHPGYPRDPHPPKKTPPYNPERRPEKPYYPRKPMHPDRKRYPPKPHPEQPKYTLKYPQYSPEVTTYTYPNRNTPTPRSDNPNYPDHPKEDPRSNKDTSRSTQIPDTCDTSYDAISIIRGEVFIFKDKYFWRIGDSGLKPDYPAEICRMFNYLPRNLTHVDAVYERPDNKIVFFIGKQYYVYKANYLEEGYPKLLSDLGLPSSLEKLDAAMVWGHNGKTYFYSGSMYWRFDEEQMKVELDYPRDIAMWRGIGTDIDAAFQWKDGKTYFFKGKGFWKFNDLRMRVEDEHQMLSAPFWMGCSKNIQGATPGKRSPYVSIPSKSNISYLNYKLFTIIIFTAVFQFCARIT